ncbi:reverse transcriptase domain-containing protein [Trichonephila clavipes]|nr:reverse transcriptase domain-containing protein [Trichonephila clavipes]
MFGIGGKALPWIYDFLRNRFIKVKFNNSLSRSFSFFQRVPQDSVLTQACSRSTCQALRVLSRGNVRSAHWPILEYGVPVYCSATITNLQKLEKVQLSAAWIITGLKNTCPRDIVLFKVDLQPLSLRRRACLTKYYNKFRSLDSQNRTSAYFKDWCNNQRLKRNSPFSQMISYNLTIGAVEPHHLSQCLDPADDLVCV